MMGKIKQNQVIALTIVVACLLILAIFAIKLQNNQSITKKTTSSSTPNSIATEGSLADDLHYGGNYYLNNWEFTVSDKLSLKKIGKVEKANRLAMNSEIYEINGYPNHDFIAVADKDSFTGFSIYVEYNGSDKPVLTPDISYLRVNAVLIYKDAELVKFIKGEDVRKFITLFEQDGPDNEFIVENPSKYHVILSTNLPLSYVYEVFEKAGVFGLPMSESKLPDEIAHYFKP